MSAPSDDSPAGRLSRVPPAAVQDALMAALHAGGAEDAGDQVGSYKLLQKIGEGGFGVVWLAEQREPIRRHVALKIIKVGMDTREVIARFEAERQALALMDHPNIARVFDAGATDAGRPFFAMELVRGVPITRYCDENRLTAEARLRLFIPVCQAVQHAHQKGVIHRDLKPSNILVTLHDGVPVPKVIDFGIAKATTGTRLTERTLVTQFRAFIGTPAYTSPEQMEMSGWDVDTRSDIYGLGVLLYELLAGRPPFDPEVLLNSGLEAMRRTVREVEPPRPSVRLNTLPLADRTTVAQQRATDAVRLTSLLRGDLDWIVMHCLEKDRTRRYETASGLARDVERYLKHEPVSARAPGTLYRGRKFIQRHRFGMAAAAAVAFSLIAGLVASAMLLMRERAARERAVVSERAEAALRREAEVARERETIRASRTARDLGAQLLSESRTAEGLAWFVQAARANPRDPTIAPRLASALAARSYLLPAGTSQPFPAPITNLHYVDGGRKIGVYCQDGTVAVIQTATGAEMRTKLPAPLGRQGVLFTDRSTVALGRDGVVRLLESATGRIEREIRFERKAVLVAARKSEAPVVLVGLEDGSAACADTQTGEIRTLPVQVPASSRVQLSPDGKWLLVGDAQDRQAVLWDLANGGTRPVPLNGRQFGPLVFSPDSQRLVVTAVSDGGWFHFQLLELTTPAAITKPVILQEQSSVSAQLVVGFSPDGRVLSIGSQFGHRLFDAVTGDPIGAPFPTGLLSAVLTTDAGKLLTVGGPLGRFRPLLFRRTGGRLQTIAPPGLEFSNELMVRDAATGQPVMPPVVHPGGIVDARLSEDGDTLLVLGRDNALLLWDLQASRPRAEPSLQQQQTNNLLLALSPDGGELAIARADGTLQRLRASRGGARALELARHAPMMPAPFLAEAPAQVLWLRGDHANVIDATAKPVISETAEFPVPILGLDRGQIGIGIRPDGRFMVVRPRAGGWQSWACDHGRIIKTVPLEHCPPGLAAVFFSPVANVAAMIDDGPTQQIRFWDLATGRLIGGPLQPAVPTSVGDSRRPACFSPDGGLFAVGGRDGVVRLWEFASGKLRVELRSNEAIPVYFLAFSADGTRLAVGNGRNETQLWDLEEKRPVGPVLEGGRTEFSPSGEQLMTSGGSTAHLWDGRTAVAIGVPMGHAGGAIRGVAFSADGRRLVTAAQDSTARIWDALTGLPVCEPMQHQTRVVSCEFSPDGRFVRTEEAGRADHATRFQIWAVPPEPAGHAAPEWLLRLAEICGQKTIDEAGRCVDLPNSLSQLEEIRRELAALPTNAPFAEWGRWILDQRPDRSIAPGFALTAAEAEQLSDLLGVTKGVEP